MNPYKVRERSIRSLGYSSYTQYLASALWKEIRIAQLASSPRCTRCAKKATQVHHASYDLATMSGDNRSALLSACAGCHRQAERRAALAGDAGDRLSSATLWLMSGMVAKGRRRRRQRNPLSATWNVERAVKLEREPFSMEKKNKRKGRLMSRELTRIRRHQDMAPRLVRKAESGHG